MLEVFVAVVDAKTRLSSTQTAAAGVRKNDGRFNEKMIGSKNFFCRLFGSSLGKTFFKESSFFLGFFCGACKARLLAVHHDKPAVHLFR